MRSRAGSLASGPCRGGALGARVDLAGQRADGVGQLGVLPCSAPRAWPARRLADRLGRPPRGQPPGGHHRARGPAGARLRRRRRFAGGRRGERGDQQGGSFGHASKSQIGVSVLGRPGVAVGGPRLHEVAAAGARLVPYGGPARRRKGSRPIPRHYHRDRGCRRGSPRWGICPLAQGVQGWCRHRGPRRRSCPSWRGCIRRPAPRGTRGRRCPRAAFSHSSSVGSRPRANAQYARASCQETWVTGRSGSSARSMGGALQRRAATQRAYIARVISVRSMRKARRRLVSIGRSSRARVEPRVNGPGRHQDAVGAGGGSCRSGGAIWRSTREVAPRARVAAKSWPPRRRRRCTSGPDVLRDFPPRHNQS